MHLFFRLFWLMLVGRFRFAVPVTGICRTPFRVLPTDLDLLRHMNNSVYLSLMDLARVDFMRRAGLFSQIASRGWYPVVVAETIQFRRSLTLFERFDIVSRLLAWDEKAILLEQRFERGEETVAVALVRARFLMRAGGSVPAADVVALAGIASDASIADVPAYATRWNTDQNTWHGGGPS